MSRSFVPWLLSCLGLSAVLAGCGNVSGLPDSAANAASSPVTVSFQDGVSPSTSYAGTADTMLQESTPTTVYGSVTSLRADRDYPDGTGKNADVLLRWDVSSIPSSATVQSVTVTLNVTNPTSGNVGYTFYALSRAWTESQASWNIAAGSTGWSAPGARGTSDRGTSALATIIPTANGKATATLNAAGIAAVQAWVKDPSKNFGLVLDSSADMDGINFDASDVSTAANRPQLKITYAPAAATGSGGTGLYAQYYDDTSLSKLAFTRTDATVNFNWTGAPGSGLTTTGYSVRWSGEVQALYSQTYTFTTTSDDGVRLWVNGKQLVNNWTDHGATANSGTIALSAGSKVPIKMEYYQNAGKAVAQLAWSSASQAKQIIPASQLFPSSPTTPPPSTDAGTPTPPPSTDAGTPAPPTGMPIKYIVVMIKENHTFDNYFAGFPGAESSLTAKLSNGTVINRPLAPNGSFSVDPCHAHSCAITQWHNGAMDQLDKVVGTGSGGMQAFSRFEESQLPNYWAYARNFVLADHFFSTTLGPSFPGHFAVAAGFNLSLANPSCQCGGTCTVPAYNPTTGKQENQVPCWDAPSVVNELPSGYNWKEYGWGTLLSVKSVASLPGVGSHFASHTQAITDVQSGSQPHLMFYHMTGQSEHPPMAVCPGENESVQFINAVMQSPHWKETAILLTWDDYGGFYDSVDPQPTKMSSGEYMRPGMRVPLLIISPYARKGYVLKTRSEQASIIKLVEDLWGLPRLGTKNSLVHDVDSGSLLGAFDFTQAPRSPLILNTRTCQ